MKRINIVTLTIILFCTGSVLLGQTYLSGDIGGMTLTPGVNWIVFDSVYVDDGDTLTILPGTVVKFTPGVEAFLMVKRGGHIHAAGTESEPITFTSAADDPQPGDWLAPMFFGNGTGQNPTWTVDSTHNLGVLRYIKMEYTYWSFGLYNVGSGTTVDHISTYNGNSFYIYGGNVNLSYLAVHHATGSGIYFRGGYTGNVSELFINGTLNGGINSSNTSGGSRHWLPPQWDPDLEPRTNPTITKVTISNSLRYSMRFRYGGVGSISNALLYNHAYRWGASIRVYDDYLLGFITLDSLQSWHCRGNLWDNNAYNVINHDHLYEQDPLFNGFVPTDTTGIGAMVNGDWLSTWGHALAIDSIAFAGFNNVSGFQWVEYLGSYQPLILPGDTLRLRTYYYVNDDYLVNSADVNIDFNSSVYDVVDVYPDTNFIPPGEASVVYNVIEDTILVSFAANTSYGGNVYLFNVDLRVQDSAYNTLTSFAPFDATVNEDYSMYFINGLWRFLVPDRIYGDVSLNGDISSYDASLILQHLIGLEDLNRYQEFFADVSGNGELSAYDATLIQQFVVALIDSFPVDTGAYSVPAEGSLSMEDQEISPGAVVSIPLNLSNGSNILSFEGRLTYNPDHLTFNDITWAYALDGFEIFINDISGLLHFAGASAYPDGQEDLFATLYFVVNEDFSEDQTDVVLETWRWNEGSTQENMASAILTRTLKVGDLGVGIPEKFALHQNHPNPFNPVTVINYDLPKQSIVTITIHDILGKQVKTLINETREAGYQSVIWDATNSHGQSVSAGLYLYQIKAGEFIQSKKMILLK